MAEVNEQAGVSNCPIFNELDNKLPNTVIDRDVHTESSTFEQTEKSDVSSCFLICQFFLSNVKY